jgi:hypothetical protein
MGQAYRSSQQNGDGDASCGRRRRRPKAVGVLRFDSKLSLTPVALRQLLDRAQRERQGYVRPAGSAPLAPAQNARRLGEQRVAELIGRYEASQSCPQLATHFKLGKSTIIRILHAHDVQMRPKHVTR